MKHIRLTEILVEIKTNIVAFFSITMFVCLGVGLFLGIQWGGTAIRNTTEEAFERGHMHDIEVVYPYGLTDDHVKQLEAVEGVTAVECSYMVPARLLRGDDSFVLKIQSLTSDIDTVDVIEGELPKAQDEIAILASWAKDHAFGVGDTIQLQHDIKDDEGTDALGQNAEDSVDDATDEASGKASGGKKEQDADGMEYLNTDHFTITALVESPVYLCKVPSSLGVVNIGSIDCAAFVDTSAFDAKRYKGAYPTASLRCDGLRGLDSFSQEYKDALRPIAAAIEELGDTLASERFQVLHGEAEAQIAEGDKKVAEGEKKLSEGADQIAEGGKKVAEGDKKAAEGDKQAAEGEKKLNEGAKQLSEGEKKLAEGAKKLEEGERKAAEGDKKIAEGEERLSEGRRLYEEARAAASAKMADAQKMLEVGKRKLDEAQAQYDRGLAQYNAAKKSYDEGVARFDSVRSSYDGALAGCDELRSDVSTLEDCCDQLEATIEAYEATEADPAATDADKDDAWTAVQASYDDVKAAHGNAQATLTSTANDAIAVAEAFGTGLTISGLSDLEPLDRTAPRTALSSARNATAVLSEGLGKIDGTTVSYGDATYRLTDIPAAIDDVKGKLDVAANKLEDAKAKLDAGRDEYNARKAEYEQKVAEGQQQLQDAKDKLDAGEGQLDEKRGELEAGKELLASKKGEYDSATKTYEQKKAEYRDALKQYEQKKAELANGKGTLAEKKAELEKAKKTLDEKRAELEGAKQKLSSAREKATGMERYEWAVSPRLENGGVQTIENVSTMMNSLRWAMASLFVLVGLFVCYSAISRLVNDEIEQIGTKKAMGFREGEIAAEYLSFSALSVLVGTIVALFVGVIVVEGIVNPKVGRQFTFPAYPPYFNLLELCLMGALELVLILLATWCAIHRLLKRNAVDLLGGDDNVQVKERFYERWGIWQRMSLYSQTIVNNCVNDPRRVLGTLVGVIGCTMLIVTAVTLASNVSRSFERQYQRVYDYTGLTVLSEGGEKTSASVSQALREQGIASAPVRRHRLLTSRQDGVRSLVTIIVPTDEEAFEQLYHVNTLSGEKVQLGDEGIWISAAFSDHMGVHAGDTLTVCETTGKTREFTVAGVFEYYLMRHEFLMSENAYLEAFGSDPEANTLLTQLGDTDVEAVRSALHGVDGFASLTDDSQQARRVFDQMSSLLRTVVLVYLGLSAVMAVVVLLNLDVMFVEEKKRELLVLRINGFSVRDAQAYIYRDSIVLTVLGIVLGVVLGTLMGGYTVSALEPDFGHFVKDFNEKAALIGAVGAGGFAMVVLFWALRQIKRFVLTDINRY